MKYLSKSEKKKRIKMSFLIAILHVGIIIIIKKGVNRSYQKWGIYWYIKKHPEWTIYNFTHTLSPENII